MPRCKSGGWNCDREAVMGHFGLNWCREHGEQLERVRRDMRKRGGTPKAVKPKPPEAKRPQQEGDSLGRLPAEVRLRRLAEHIATEATADAPVSRADAARAIGLSPSGGSLPRLLKRATEAGLVEVKRGPNGGLVPGPNAKLPAAATG